MRFYCISQGTTIMSVSSKFFFRCKRIKVSVSLNKLFRCKFHNFQIQISKYSVKSCSWNLFQIFIFAQSHAMRIKLIHLQKVNRAIGKSPHKNRDEIHKNERIISFAISSNLINMRPIREGISLPEVNKWTRKND